MCKVQWDIASDEFKHCFVVCNERTAFNLYHILTNTNLGGGCSPINVKIFDLSGNEIEKTYDIFSKNEYTHN